MQVIKFDNILQDNWRPIDDNLICPKCGHDIYLSDLDILLDQKIHVCKSCKTQFNIQLGQITFIKMEARN